MFEQLQDKDVPGTVSGLLEVGFLLQSECLRVGEAGLVKIYIYI